MKKSLLLFVVLFGVFANAISQRASLTTIPYSDGKTYNLGAETKILLPATLDLGNGTTIFIGGNSGYNGNDFFDLSAYNGIEVKMSFPASAIGKKVLVRFSMVNPNDNVNPNNIVKEVVVASESEIVRFDFDKDAPMTRKLWAIKTPWGGSDAISGVVFEYIDAITFFTSVADNKVQTEDPNRLVDVYSITGSIVRQAVEFSRATEGLGNGLYVIDGKKVCVKNN